MRILLLAIFYQAVAPVGTFAAAEISHDTVALENVALSPDDIAVETALPTTYRINLPKQSSVKKPAATKVASFSHALSADSPAVETLSINADSVAVAEISPDDIAVEDNLMPVRINEPQRIKTPPAQIVQYARDFWQEADEQIEKRNINISGTKTFEMKKADVSGDISHFSSENFDSIPGFKLDQSMHLEVSGNITETATVHAVLDDKEDEDRRFTVNIDGPVWKFVMGDFPLAIEGTEFALFRKEVKRRAPQQGGS